MFQCNHLARKREIVCFERTNEKRLSSLMLHINSCGEENVYAQRFTNIQCIFVVYWCILCPLEDNLPVHYCVSLGLIMIHVHFMDDKSPPMEVWLALQQSKVADALPPESGWMPSAAINVIVAAAQNKELDELWMEYCFHVA